MIWKVLYDFRRPNWKAYGHVLFVEAESEGEALVGGRHAAQEAEPDATMERVDVFSATTQQRDRHNRLRVAQAVWKANTAAGLPNDPKSL